MSTINDKHESFRDLFAPASSHVYSLQWHKPASSRLPAERHESEMLPLPDRGEEAFLA